MKEFWAKNKIALITALLLVSIVSVLIRYNSVQKLKFTPYTYPVLTDLTVLLNRGKIKVLTDYSSTGYFIYKGQTMGFEYEALSDFAKSMGLGLEFIIADDMNKVFYYLNNGDADIVAANITVTSGRKKICAFTQPLFSTRQVLVQRKIKNKKTLSSLSDLNGIDIHVRKNSSFYERLKNLKQETGYHFNIHESDGELTTEELIAMVAGGEIDYTVADENVAQINKLYYPNLDTGLEISMPQEISFAVRKTSPRLLEALNNYISERKKTGYLSVLYNKYYNSAKEIMQRYDNKYYSLTGGQLSEYDKEIKQYSKKISWDWRLIAAIIYQESKFDTGVVSWAGAKGIMQLLPATQQTYGVDSNDHSVKGSLTAGTRMLKKLNTYWKHFIPDSLERLCFVLASYNAGLGHVIDARNLAIKYGYKGNSWNNNVAYFLLNKSKEKYYKDAVVKYGYCKGAEPVNYVNEILETYHHYTNLLKDDENSIVINN